MLNPIEHIKVEPKMTVSTLLKEFGNGSFTARKLYEAYQILDRMSKDHGCLKFLTVAGAAVPAEWQRRSCSAVRWLPAPIALS